MSKGKVIINVKSSYADNLGTVPQDIVKFLKSVAAKYGNVGLNYLYGNEWAMVAPKGYRWLANCSPSRVIGDIEHTRRIVSAGLVKESLIKAYKNRFQNLCGLFNKYKALQDKGVRRGCGGFYPKNVVSFTAPVGYVWKATRTAYATKKTVKGETEDFTVGDEAVLRKIFSTGLIKANSEPVQECPLVIEYTVADGIFKGKIVSQTYPTSGPEIVMINQAFGSIKCNSNPFYDAAGYTLWLRGTYKEADLRSFLIGNSTAFNDLAKLVSAYGGKLVKVPSFTSQKESTKYGEKHANPVSYEKFQPLPVKSVPADPLQVVKDTLQGEKTRIVTLLHDAEEKIRIGKEAEKTQRQYKKQLNVLDVAWKKLTA